MNGILSYSLNYSNSKKLLKKPVVKELTIPTTGWIDNRENSSYKKIVLPLDGVNSSSIINCSVLLDYNDIALECGLALINESGDNTITFFATNIPSSDIKVSYYILEGADK